MSTCFRAAFILSRQSGSGERIRRTPTPLLTASFDVSGASVSSSVKQGKQPDPWEGTGGGGGEEGANWNLEH